MIFDKFERWSKLVLGAFNDGEKLSSGEIYERCNRVGRGYGPSAKPLSRGRISWTLAGLKRKGLVERHDKWLPHNEKVILWRRTN